MSVGPPVTGGFGVTRVRCSPKELRVLSALAAGKTYEVVATELHLAPSTVRFHAAQLQRRFGVSNNAALAALAVLTGLLMPGQWPPELSGLMEIELPS